MRTNEVKRKRDRDSKLEKRKGDTKGREGRRWLETVLMRCGLIDTT